MKKSRLKKQINIKQAPNHKKKRNFIKKIIHKTVTSPPPFQVRSNWSEEPKKAFLCLFVLLFTFSICIRNGYLENQLDTSYLAFHGRRDHSTGVKNANSKNITNMLLISKMSSERKSSLTQSCIGGLSKTSPFLIVSLILGFQFGSLTFEPSMDIGP